MFKDYSRFFPLDSSNLVNRNHPLIRGITSWWMVIPGLAGGNKFYDLMNNNPGILQATHGNNLWYTSTRANSYGSINFLGNGDFVETNYTFPTTNFSYMLWIKSSVTGPTCRPFGNADATNGLSGSCIIWGFTDSNNLYVVNRHGSNDGSEDITISVSNLTIGWHHIAVTFNSTTGLISVYYDGVLKQTTSTNSGVITNAFTAKIGKDSGDSGFIGQVDDVRIYNRPLSSTEIFSIYQNSLVGYPNIFNRVDFSIPTKNYYFDCLVGNQRLPFAVRLTGV